MTAMPDTTSLLHTHYNHLMQHRSGDPNDDLIAKMYASWLCGQGSMPLNLGLPLDIFRTMMDYHFPGLSHISRPAQIRHVDTERLTELDDLRTLLHQSHSHSGPDAGWMVEILCGGCMGGDHLWQDLGLWSRKDLSRLMYDNFRPLAERNDKDMKWKKFLYKQMCEGEGIYVCRSPSCEVCVDYQACFGPED